MSQKVVLITGSSRGIGKAIALEFKARGYLVAGTATTEKGAEAISEYLGDNGKGFVLELTKTDSIEPALATIKETLGNIDILVNNAGITRDNLLMRMKDDEWQDIISTNLQPIFYLSRAVIKTMMKNRFGRIIQIGSVVGSMGNAGQTNYCAAKAGVIGFSKALAKEVASRGITVNVVAPGFIETDMTHALNEQQQAAIMSMVPAGRLGTPEDIAKTVAFLASDDAAYINGSTIHVNGGLYMD